MGVYRPVVIVDPGLGAQGMLRQAARPSHSGRPWLVVTAILALAVLSAFAAFFRMQRDAQALVSASSHFRDLTSFATGVVSSPDTVGAADASASSLSSEVAKVAGDVLFALLPDVASLKSGLQPPPNHASSTAPLNQPAGESAVADRPSATPSAPASVPAPPSQPGDWRTWALRSEPAEPTPYPASHISKLVQAARAEGVRVPDVLRRGRSLATTGGDQFGGCPPYHGAVPSLEDIESEAMLEVLGRYRVALVTVSYMSPKSLAGAVPKWADNGLLDLVDDKVMWLNAPLQEEIDLGLKHGFKVLPSYEDVIRASVNRTAPLIDIQYREHVNWPRWPYMQRSEKDGSTSLWVAPSLLLAQYETSAEVTLFLEKDYVVNPMPRKRLIRDLLAAVALIHYRTSVVRIRKRDDPERGSIPDVCGELYRFSQPCHWNAHLAWLYAFCARDERRIEQETSGHIKMCYDGAVADVRPAGASAAALAAQDFGDPLRVHCFSFDYSGWSNNAALFGRQWWLHNLDDAAILTDNGNGMFEVNAMLRCRKKGAAMGGVGESMAPHVCQLFNGIVNHEEIDQ